MDNGSVKIVGLRELQAELRAVDSTLPKQLRLVNLQAAELVSTAAVAMAMRVGGAVRKAAPSIKAVAQQRSAAVKIGGSRYPFALGGEFGSIRFKQFKPWRGSDADAGYALFPAKRAKTDEVVELYGDLLEELTKTVFPT